jgi:hypothetical protein
MTGIAGELVDDLPTQFLAYFRELSGGQLAKIFGRFYALQ